MATVSSFKSLENKHDVYRGKDCMKKFCKSLREHVMEIINFKKKKNLKLLTNKQQKSYEKLKNCYACKEKFEDKLAEDKRHHKVRDHCSYTGEYRGDAYRIFNIKYSVPKEIFTVFRNGFNYDYHFIIKELPKELEQQFTCLEENTERCITFTVPMQKEVTRTNKKRYKYDLIRVCK